jgi:hypothetical protein
MNYSSLYTTQEVLEMNQDINEIRTILNIVPFDIERARNKVNEINEKHPENCGIYKLISQSKGPGISVGQASALNLKDDLNWKVIYLSAKITGKSIDELAKELRNANTK